MTTRTYEFGVMSSKYSLEAVDLRIAKIAIAIYIGSNVPVAIYKPVPQAFMPADVLTEGLGEEIERNAVSIKTALKSIKVLK